MKNRKNKRYAILILLIGVAYLLYKKLSKQKAEQQFKAYETAAKDLPEIRQSSAPPVVAASTVPGSAAPVVVNTNSRAEELVKRFQQNKGLRVQFLVGTTCKAVKLDIFGAVQNGEQSLNIFKAAQTIAPRGEVWLKMATKQGNIIFTNTRQLYSIPSANITLV